MKPSGELFLEQKQSRRLGVDVREASRWPRGREARPHPRGPLVDPLTDFFRLYIYPYTLKPSGSRIDQQFRRRKPLQPPKTNRDPVPAPCRRGDPSPMAIFIIPAPSMTRRDSSPSGLTVCTSSYVFDLSLVFFIWHDLDVSRPLLLQLHLMMFLPLYSLVMD